MMNQQQEVVQEQQKLSALIRVGAALHPQVYGELVQVEQETGYVLGTCAIGAAYEACLGITQLIEKNEELGIYDIAKELEPYMPYSMSDVIPLKYVPTQARSFVTHSSDKHNYLISIIIILNDELHWTREQIADWLESLEC